jgi:hypothetical protein
VCICMLARAQGFPCGPKQLLCTRTLTVCCVVALALATVNATLSVGRCVIVRYGFLLTEGNLATEALDAVCDGMCPACANICNCAVRFLTSNRVFLKKPVCCLESGRCRCPTIGNAPCSGLAGLISNLSRRSTSIYI